MTRGKNKEEEETVWQAASIAFSIYAENGSYSNSFSLKACVIEKRNVEWVTNFFDIFFILILPALERSNYVEYKH